jgi:aminobenzoyl-glutamate transport protein
MAFFALLTLPPGAPLRNPYTGAILGNSPLMSGLIVAITIVFLVAGAAYGLGAGTMKGSKDILGAMTKAVAGLAGLLFLLFVISQFIALFNYSNMATIAAVKLADILTSANLDALWLLLGFIAVVFALDLIITGAIPKWAIFAPLFVPLLLRLNVDPEAVLAAYRVADSPMNSITPLNAYFALVVTFCQKYQKDAGVGTVVALMLPYVVIVAVVWVVLFAAWHLLGLPWGL